VALLLGRERAQRSMGLVPLRHPRRFYPVAIAATLAPYAVAGFPTELPASKSRCATTPRVSSLRLLRPYTIH
jgi:hypothetical protein